MTDKKMFSATGNQMVADAFRQVNPDVMAAYPITPQTTIVEGYAKFVADGKVTTEYVPVESEHSALSACIGASAAGARVATATSSQGLAFMWEELHVASGMRCPIVMANANRALSAPINIHGDHSDIMGARDTGWCIMFAETAQEAYDNTIIAFRVAEDPNVLLPVLTTLDGFVTTHAMDCCVMEEDQVVKDYVGEYKPLYPLLDTDNPVGQGMFATLGNGYMKYKLTERQAADNALEAFEKHGKEWAEITGRPFDLVDAWGCEDARTNYSNLLAFSAKFTCLETSVTSARTQNNNDIVGVFATPSVNKIKRTTCNFCPLFTMLFKCLKMDYF